MVKQKKTKKSALERLPGHEEATRFYFALQGWREAANIFLTAGSTVCFTVAGTTGFEVPGFLGINTGAWWVVGGALLAAALGAGQLWLFKPSYGELVRDRDAKIRQLETRELEFAKAESESEAVHQEARNAHQRDLQMVLDSLATQLLEYICKAATDCRISTYSVEGDEFSLLSRCSRNPQLEVRGRSAYPLNEGTIGKAWAKEWALQDFEASEREEWEAGLVAAGLFTKETTSILTMRSRNIYAQRIDRGSDKIGMIVLECEDGGRFNENAVKRVRSSLIVKAIAEILWSSHMHFPRVHERKEELAGPQKRTVVVPEPAWKRAKPIRQEAVVQSTEMANETANSLMEAGGSESPSSSGEGLGTESGDSTVPIETGVAE